MSRPEVPRHQQGPLELLKWFVLVVALAPMLCCAGCLGYGFLVAHLQQPEGGTTPPAPAETGRER